MRSRVQINLHAREPLCVHYSRRSYGFGIFFRFYIIFTIDAFAQFNRVTSAHGVFVVAVLMVFGFSFFSRGLVLNTITRNWHWRISSARAVVLLIQYNNYLFGRKPCTVCAYILRVRVRCRVCVVTSRLQPKWQININVTI